MNVLLKEREVAFYVRDSGAKVLFAWHEFAAPAHAGAEQSGSEVLLVQPGQLEQLLARCEPAPEVAARAADDTAVILYTRDDGNAEGRRAHARQPRPQRR